MVRISKSTIGCCQCYEVHELITKSVMGSPYLQKDSCSVVIEFRSKSLFVTSGFAFSLFLFQGWFFEGQNLEDTL